MKNTLILLVLAITLFSCKKTEPEINKPKTVNIKTVKDTFLDTIVNIFNIEMTENQNFITNKMATETLNNYFKSKGFLIQSEINKDLNIPRLPKNKGKNVIEFLELFLFNKQLGIITYFNAPAGAVGHCVQPHLAVISYSNNGLLISNEEFLPPNFSIDSVKIIDNKPVIYSRDYDCYNNKFLKKYRIELK